MDNQIVWVDIPVTNLDRAIKFYSAVLGSPVKKNEYPGMTIGMLPGTDTDVTGCLSPADKPAREGPLLYFNCDGRIDAAVAAVVPNGGQIVEPPKKIGPYGYRAVILDSEGNRVALHSH